MRLDRFPILFLLLVVLFSSCEKKESPITLPPKTASQISRVDMGEDYNDQIFFDFETGQSVMTSQVSSWDLAFETSPTGFHVFMNGGNLIRIYNTHAHNASSITEANAVVANESDWLFDAPCGLADSTGLGEWRDASGNSKNEVLIVKLLDGSYRKIVLVSVNPAAYVLAYGDINSTSLTSITIPKNPLHNYSYFSFENGGAVVSPEPPKDSWDIVFTRYRHVYYELNNFQYLVTGALLNPENTTAKADSTTPYSSIVVNNTSSVLNTFSNHRDVIGFDWKSYDIDKALYTVKQNKCYVVRTRKNQYWKIHFLDFYNLNKQKGSPSFEYERIQ